MLNEAKPRRPRSGPEGGLPSRSFVCFMVPVLMPCDLPTAYGWSYCPDSDRPPTRHLRPSRRRDRPCGGWRGVVEPLSHAADRIMTTALRRLFRATQDRSIRSSMNFLWSALRGNTRQPLSQQHQQHEHQHRLDQRQRGLIDRLPGRGSPCPPRRHHGTALDSQLGRSSILDLRVEQDVHVRKVTPRMNCASSVGADVTAPAVVARAAQHAQGNVVVASAPSASAVDPALAARSEACTRRCRSTAARQRVRGLQRHRLLMLFASSPSNQPPTRS